LIQFPACGSLDSAHGWYLGFSIQLMVGTFSHDDSDVRNLLAGYVDTDTGVGSLSLVFLYQILSVNLYLLSSLCLTFSLQISLSLSQARDIELNRSFADGLIFSR
jgi:hypothetical protein